MIPILKGVLNTTIPFRGTLVAYFYIKYFCRGALSGDRFIVILGPKLAKFDKVRMLCEVAPL
jgi:hypothetical protein